MPFTSSRLECALATVIGEEILYQGFGCTDCKCDSHLFYRKENPFPEVIEAFKALGLSPF